ncbi:MAG: SLATT domain-containing protein [Rhodocyclales bacterium]|nr:SLATT domain-containing protein [Rhodocyclales bacterium]
MHDNIWFTYKARIRAHLRLASNDFHTQLLMVWYALAGSLLGVVSIRYPKILGNDTDLIAALISTALLVISMLVANRDFRGRAIQMRTNYLALGELYRKANNGGVSQEQANSEYQQLLNAVEIHSEIDDKYFRVFHSGNLTSRQPTLRERADVISYIVTRTLGLAACYLLPVVSVFASW